MHSHLQAEVILDAENVVIIQGPARFHCSGSASILGCPIRDQELTIRGDFYLPVETDHDCRIHVNSARGVIVRDRKNSGTAVWRERVRSIATTDPKSIMIIGQNDTGKSTLSVYLTNEFINRGHRVVLIDADVGQGDLAPPTCIGAVYRYTQLLNGRMVKPHRWGFIGKTSPHGVERLISQTVIEMCHSFPRGVRIINTDGFVDSEGPGFEYKAYFARNIHPTLILILGNTEIYERFRGTFGNNVLFLPSPAIPHRSPSMRAEKRLRQFRRFVGKRTYRAVSREGVRYWKQGTCTEWSTIDPAFPDVMNMFVGLTELSPRELEQARESRLAVNRPVGHLGVGVIRRIDTSKDEMTIQTLYDRDCNTILLSSVKLDEYFSREEKIPNGS